MTTGDLLNSRMHQLMPYRVRQVLLVASQYDAFIIEEDGRLADLLGQAYKQRDLGYVPTIFRVTGGQAAIREVGEQAYDLVVAVQRLGDMDPFSFGRAVKQARPGTPVVLLAYNTPELHRMQELDDRSAIDRIFVWLGDGRILAGIIQYAEDLRNAGSDTRLLGLQNILVIEDSAAFYSAYLPAIFEELRLQTEALLQEGLSYGQRAFRQMARPRVHLASTYEEALNTYREFKGHLLGVISDVRFPRDGKLDNKAGIDFAKMIRADQPHLPILIQSSEAEARGEARALGAEYLDKNSPTLVAELRRHLLDHFGFGDLVLAGADGKELTRLSHASGLMEALERIPDDALIGSLADGRIVRWLMARTELDLARIFADAASAESADAKTLRAKLARSVLEMRRQSHRGSLVPFTRSFFKDPAVFSRIGGGSIGGKARGLAFIDRVLTDELDPGAFPGVELSIPKTLVLGTDVFDAFIRDNNLLSFAAGESSDVRIANAFLNGSLSARVVGDLRDFIAGTRSPLAVRSSSLLEDALYQPFAGVYATKMIPNNQPDTDSRFLSLINAVKFVYASTFFRQARAYIESTGHRAEEEKMAVLIQEVVGNDHRQRFYPDFSGVARSYNYYPVGAARPEDGVANVALGLGKTVVDGGLSLRFTPAYPQVLPQFNSTQDMLDNSQRQFYAIDMTQSASTAFAEEDQYLVKLGLDAAERDGALAFLGSTYSIENESVYDGISSCGPRIVSFAHVLKSGVFPLAAILQKLLQVAERAMACPVEMEFAVTLDPATALPARFGFLQVRPLVVSDELVRVSLEDHRREEMAVHSRQVLGNGVNRDIRDIVMVKRQAFNAAHNPAIAGEVDNMNQRLRSEERPYLLIGPGRWGSSDHWLGIPVSWSQITGVKAVVEASLPNMNVDPSQGSHFFQNMTSLRIGYFTVPLNPEQGFIDWEWLESLPAIEETEHLRLLRLETPLEVQIDGRKGEGMVLKPEGTASEQTASARDTSKGP